MIPAWYLAALVTALVILAGLDGSLAVLALSMLAYNRIVPLHAEFMPLAHGYAVFMAGVYTLLQVLLNLYFVPVRVQDCRYVAPARTANAHLHARFQSVFRPLVAVVVVAAVPTDLPVQPLAVAGFVVATAMYWFSAWVREYVAIARGTLVLMLLETLKQILLLFVMVVLFWSPFVAVASLVAALTPAAVWTARLQREVALPRVVGGMGVADDT